MWRKSCQLIHMGISQSHCQIIYTTSQQKKRDAEPRGHTAKRKSWRHSMSRPIDSCLYTYIILSVLSSMINILLYAYVLCSMKIEAQLLYPHSLVYISKFILHHRLEPFFPSKFNIRVYSINTWWKSVVVLGNLISKYVYINTHMLRMCWFLCDILISMLHVCLFTNIDTFSMSRKAVEVQWFSQTHW